MARMRSGNDRAETQGLLSRLFGDKQKEKAKGSNASNSTATNSSVTNSSKEGTRQKSRSKFTVTITHNEHRLPASDAETEPIMPSPPEGLAISLSDYELMKIAMCRQQNTQLVRQGYIHGYAIAKWCQAIAQKRGLDPQLAVTIGLLHDVYYFSTGILYLRVINSAEQVRELLSRSGMFDAERAATIVDAIKSRNKPAEEIGEYALMLKDAHIINRYTGQRHAVWDDDLARLVKLLPEWELSAPLRSQVFPRRHLTPSGSRSSLADVAQTVASSHVTCYNGDREMLNIARYWPEEDAIERLKGRWGAAFVYHCCMESGFYLPIRLEGFPQRFDSVKTWLDFGSMLENGFYHARGEMGFTPERGDIVIFDRMLEDKEPYDHMGVVVLATEDIITVAEGNARGSNMSDVLEHSSTHHVRGYIRLPNCYSL